MLIPLHAFQCFLFHLPVSRLFFSRDNFKYLYFVKNIFLNILFFLGNKSWLYRIFCTGGINLKDPDNPKDNPENGVMVWCRDFLGNNLSKWPVKMLIILIFVAYLAGAIYGTTRIQEGLQRRKLSKPDSYSVEFYDREDFYFREYPYRIQVNGHE